MKNCNFQLNTDGTWQCEESDWIFPRKIPKPPKGNCPICYKRMMVSMADEDRQRMAAMAAPPGTALTPAQKAEQEEQQKQIEAEIQAESDNLGWDLNTVKRYWYAVVKWRKAGRPKRTDEEVDHIHENICKPCNHYSKKWGACKKCHCRVNKSSLAVLNKIRMATEDCPLGKWPKVTETEDNEENKGV